MTAAISARQGLHVHVPRPVISRTPAGQQDSGRRECPRTACSARAGSDGPGSHGSDDEGNSLAARMNTTRRIIAAVMTLTVLSAMGGGFANFDVVGPLLYILAFAYSYSVLKRTTEWKCCLAIGVGSLATLLTIVVGTYLLDRVDIRQFFPFPVSLPVAACMALLCCLVNGALLGFAGAVFGAMLDRHLTDSPAS